MSYKPFELQFHRKKMFLNNFQGDHDLQPINNLRFIITPHAGLSYSGKLLDFAYSQVPWNEITKILMLSTNHQNKDNWIPDSESFDLTSSQKKFTFNDFLNISNFVKKSDDLFLNEHSWLVQMPFLKHNVDLCIILVGYYDQKLVDHISDKIDQNTLVIANTDLLHCGERFNIKCDSNVDQYNEQTIQKIKNLDIDGYEDKSMCGLPAIKTFLSILENQQIFTSKHKYYSSSDITNNKDSSVGYVSVLFYDHHVEKEIPLIKIPRTIMEMLLHEYKNHKQYENLDFIQSNDDIDQIIEYFKIHYSWDKLSKDYGIFVTINSNNDMLRGCIGIFSPSESGYSIAKQTLLSAFFDSRFKPVTLDEISGFKYKINFIASPFVIYEYDPNKDFNNPNTSLLKSNIKFLNNNEGHGITIKFKNNSQATYLASVLPSFEIIDLESLENKWNYLVHSMYKKAGNNISTSHNKLESDKTFNNLNDEIQTISLYLCKEFDENDNNFDLIGGSKYKYKINYSNLIYY